MHNAATHGMTSHPVCSQSTAPIPAAPSSALIAPLSASIQRQAVPEATAGISAGRKNSSSKYRLRRTLPSSRRAIRYPAASVPGTYIPAK